MNQKEQQLRIQLGQLDQQLEEFRGKTEGTESDLRRINFLCDEMEKINAQIRAEQAHDDTQRPINEPTLPPDPSGDIYGGRNMGDKREFYRQFGEFLQATARAGTPAGSVIAGKPTGIIDRAALIPQEMRSTGLEESTPSLGGFTVGTDLESQIFATVRETSIVYNQVRKLEISAGSNSVKIPTVDSTSRADGSRPLRGFWTNEGSEKTASKPDFGQLELSLNKLTILVYSSDELLQDSLALGQFIATAAAREIGFKLDDAVINGTGAGQPVGIANAAALVSVAKETGQAADTLVLDNFLKMWARLYPGGRANSTWLMNADTIPELYKISLAVGTGGAGAFLPSNAGATTKPNDTLFGRPILYTEQNPTLGDKGDVILADLSQWIAIEKGGIQSASSIHVAFTADETVFRFVFRVDGQSLWSAAVSPFKGSDSVSPFVTLDERAAP